MHRKLRTPQPFTFEHKNTGIKGHLLVCKTRLALIKRSTIPGLELMEVLIGTRQFEYISQQLHLENVEKYVWTDSQCTLQQIHSSGVHQKDRFVENQLRDIWKTDAKYVYIPSDFSPAGIPRRGGDLGNLVDNNK
uniref:Uncharacterized protein n=1 Tax=Parascaris equorum TaxID=6256 RepID=A0A914RXT4_PAREQ